MVEQHAHGNAVAFGQLLRDIFRQVLVDGRIGFDQSAFLRFHDQRGCVGFGDAVEPDTGKGLRSGLYPNNTLAL